MKGELEATFIEKLRSFKYTIRADIRDRATLKKNFREKFEELDRVRLTDGEFLRLFDEISTADVFAAARTPGERNAFTRDDGTPLNYTLVDIKDWGKNAFERGSRMMSRGHANTSQALRRRIRHRINSMPRSRPRRRTVRSAISRGSTWNLTKR